jgi:hypothetical protein
MKAVALILTVLLCASPAGAADQQRPHYAQCRHQHLSVSGTGGGSLVATHLRVVHISCAHAAAAIKAGSYEATPGGPLFSIPGFTCIDPIGPPPPGSKPRYYRCRNGIRRFEFLVPGFS